jgi:peptidoglycan/xylan/chitin deacetylase (PgdA/CDA1 family)
VLAAGSAALLATPSLASLGGVRRALTPAVLPMRLSGQTDTNHVALTFDDGPDRVSTPRFLTLLDRLGVRATFFLLGRHVDDVGLVQEMAAADHELAVHGWDHRPVALHGPRQLREGIRRTRELLEDTTGRQVAWYRPPYGLVTTHAWWAARSAGLETVLWTAWGRDWEHRASVGSIVGRVLADTRPGGTVLLHDSDRTSAAGSWQSTLAATEVLVETWRERGTPVGTLGAHLGGRPASVGQEAGVDRVTGW